MSPLCFRRLFCLAAAISAAAVADPLIEAASNAGWFGQGNYTDHSNLDVVPAFATAIGFVLLYVFLSARTALSGRSVAFDQWLRDSKRALGSQPVAKLMPAIFATQLAVLFGMETVEQIVYAGHALGGTIWLGAPVPIALALHGVACVIATCLLVRVLHALTRAAVDIVRLVRAVFLEVLRDHLCTSPLRLERIGAAHSHPLASRTGKRAPPFLTA